MRRFIIFALLAAVLPLGAFEVKQSKVDNVLMTRVDSPWFKITVNPLGGRFWSIFSKEMKSELIDTVEGGSGTENVWNVAKSRFFLRNKPFAVSTEKFPDRVVVTSVGNHAGAGINFLKVKKDYILWKNAAKITIDYDLENMDAAMSPLVYGFWFHHMIGEHNVKNDFFFPTINGIVRIKPNKRPTDTWQFRAARGWLGNADPVTGKGVAITMSYPELQLLYSWFGGCAVPSTEWRFEQVTIDAGKSFKTRAEVLPFTGLKKISGAGNGLVGELRGSDIETDKSALPVEVRVHNAEAGSVEAEVMVRKAPDGKWKSIQKNRLVFKAPGTVDSFKVTIPGEEETLQEIEVILRSGKKEMARLNGFVNFDGAEDKWSIAALEEKKVDARSRVELLNFTNVNPTPHIPWAKPLPGGKIKTLVLTDNDAILETGDLSQRLDMDYTVPFIMNLGRYRTATPIYVIGKYFGMLSVNNINENIKRAFKKKIDLIIIAGLPWSHFTSEQKKMILDRVSKGAGLIYIGTNKAEKFMPLTEAKGKKVFRGVPKAVQKSFVTSGIPFELFGAEPIYRYNARKENILATAAGVPYLVKGKLGKGKVYFLNYMATFGRFDAAGAFTPDFNAEYPDRKAPYEFYYSLIAKLALSAANRTPAVTLEPSFANGKATVRINAPGAQKVTLQATLRDSFMETRFEKEFPVELKKGVNTVNIPGVSASHADLLNYSIILRNSKKEVLNWGTWSVRKPAQAKIGKVTADKKFYTDGSTMNYTVSLKGKTAGLTVKTTLIDTFKRAFPVKTVKGAPEIKGSARITNELCSRFGYLRVQLMDGKNEIDRYELSFPVRPSDKAKAWREFEIGAWVAGEPRKHLWHLYGELLHKYQIDTLIANWGVLQTAFPIRHNIHPTRLHHLGITRCPEPLDYAKTGNKLLLVRKPCLSDPAFLDKYIKSFTRTGLHDYQHGMRFYWMGDEQSITGYGGTPVDFCFSEHCLKEFRKFVQKKYGSLAKLNSVWNTRFASWEKVIPFTKDEVWKGASPAGWADHLEFMDGRLENVAKILFAALRKHDPDARTSLSGTQPSTAYGGMDWSRLMKHFNGLMNYGLGGQFEIQRSLRPGAELMPWEFGYSRSSHYRTWRALFCGMRGMFGFSWYSLCNPDGTPSPQLEIVQRPFSIIKSGLGAHWINNVKEKADVALLYSQSSIRGAFIEKRHRSRNTSFDKYNKLLRNCGYSFNYITSEQLEEGILLKERYKYLILMDANAMSDKEIAAVETFVKKGGRVFAEGIPARRYADCRLRKAPGLAHIFKIKGNHLKKELCYKYLSAMEFPNTPANAALIAAERKRLFSVLGASGAPEITCDGKVVTDAELYQRTDKNGNSYIGITTPSAKPRGVRIALGKKAHVYDMISGKYFGYTAQLEIPVFTESSSLLLALLKEKVQKGVVSAKGNSITVTFGNKKYATALNVQLFDPAGKEVKHYSKRLLPVNGKCQYSVPFAPSDPAGKWRCVITDVTTGEKSVVTLLHR